MSGWQVAVIAVAALTRELNAYRRQHPRVTIKAPGPSTRQSSLQPVTTPSYWHPSSEADIQRAIDDALLSETHYLDCKPGVNTGLAAVTGATARVHKANIPGITGHTGVHPGLVVLDGYLACGSVLLSIATTWS
jgi:hypothetical protein